jgi:O-antigen ligase/polysaccharide polymerase Wzy-like membrane protein
VLALAGLQALSAAWAIVPAGDSLRAAALTVGYAAFMVAGSTQSAHRLAAVIAVVAGVTGLMGLVSASLYSHAFAERIEGGWRPEGPFGYPPALALVQVFALPALVTAVVRARPALAGLAAAGMAVAGGVLVLVANRVSLAFAIAVLGIAFAVSARRGLTVLALGLLAVAALAFHQLLGGWTSRFAGAGPGTALAVLGVICGLALLWILVRRPLGSTGLDRNLAVRPAFAAGAALAAVAIVAGLFSAGALSARRFDAHQSFTHGRTWMWSAAYHSAVQRPLYGFGAGSFFEATVSRQPGHGRVTRFAHDLPLEMGVESGIAGVLLALALYAAVGRALWRARGSPALWLLGPAAAAFLLANLVDWPWHLAGVGALAALALGGLTPARARRP